MENQKKKGLSLIETLITIAILGIIVLGSSKVISSFTHLNVKVRKTTERNRTIENVFKMIKKDAELSEKITIKNKSKKNSIIFAQRKEVVPQTNIYTIISKLEYIMYKSNTTTNTITVTKLSDENMVSNSPPIDEIKGYNVSFKKSGKILIITLSYKNENNKIITVKDTVVID